MIPEGKTFTWGITEQGILVTVVLTTKDPSGRHFWQDVERFKDRTEALLWIRDRTEGKVK